MSTPTLVIGLGGTGLTIVKKIIELASVKQRKNLGFVVFDTDVNELRSVEDAKLGIHTIQVSTSLTVGEYLQQDDNAREKWFPVNQVLNSKLMTNGAGQVRAVSRLAFNTALVQGKLAPLDEAISELYRLNGEKLDQAPRIIITGSLCGGTGSGLSLPVALYTRNYLETRTQQGSCIVRGFFLLPEVFYNVIEGNSERDNLRANAYAALREIDAFIMKADGNLPKEYDLQFTIPRVNAREEDEYTGRPMDFCFLFDGQNMKGQSLGSFDEYLTHAANCIYGMAIAPTSRRSNSSEDNVIRDIMAEKGRNRYAGAGTSMLIYPVKDVKRYLSLRWTEEIVSNEWVKNDRAFKYQLENNRLRRNEGAPVVPLDRGKEYMDAVLTGKSQNDPFSREVWRNCTVFEDDAEKLEKHSKAEGYVERLYAYISNEIRRYRNEQEDIEKKLEDHQADVVGKSGGDLQKEFTSWAKDLAAWKSISEDATAHCGEVMSFTLFKDPADFTAKKEEDYRIEHWLFSKDKFIHPNAVRYFIYDATTRLDEARAGMESEYQKITKEYNDKFLDLFDLEETPEKKESAPEYIQANKLNRSITIFNRGRFKGSVEEITERMLSLKTIIDKLWKCNAERIILANAVEYLKALSKSYETFFDAVDRYCVVMHDEIEHLENKYQMKDGKAIRYVCADKECLRAIGEELVNKSNTMDLPSNLNRKIYIELRKAALQSIKDSRRGLEKDQKADLITANRFCISVFNETIVKYMEQEIEEEYDTRVNMDVLSALEQEAIYRKNGEEMTNDVRSQYIENYMKDVIERTELLASPFIESPRDRQNRTIETCTYSSNLVSSDLPVPGRLDFVRQNLPNGVVSDDIDPTMILFYQAVYAIEAADLGKFAPAKVTSTTSKPAGDYYKAYHSLISKLHPDTQASRKITPHIDRWWHLVTKTPELSEQAQRQQKKDIMRALVWSLLGGYVQFFNEKNGSERRYYKRSVAKITIEGETDTKLIVSNGTPCDQLFELQDALTIYPELIYAILNDVDTQIRLDSDNGYNTAIEEKVLYQCLSEFKVKEFPLKKTVTKEDGKVVTIRNAVRSIFELPLLLKRSVPAPQYNASDMLMLIDTIIEELYNYHVTMFEKDDPGDMIKAYDSMLLSQFRLMQENIGIEAQTAREEAEKKGVSLSWDIETDVLYYDLIERLIKEINEHGYPKDAKEIRKALNKQDDE